MAFGISKNFNMYPWSYYIANTNNSIECVFLYEWLYTLIKIFQNSECSIKIKINLYQILIFKDYILYSIGEIYIVGYVCVNIAIYFWLAIFNCNLMK